MWVFLQVFAGGCHIDIWNGLLSLDQTGHSIGLTNSVHLAEELMFGGPAVECRLSTKLRPVSKGIVAQTCPLPRILFISQSFKQSTVMWHNCLCMPVCQLSNLWTVRISCRLLVMNWGDRRQLMQAYEAVFTSLEVALNRGLLQRHLGIVCFALNPNLHRNWFNRPVVVELFTSNLCRHTSHTPASSMLWARRFLESCVRNCILLVKVTVNYVSKCLTIFPTFVGYICVYFRLKLGRFSMGLENNAGMCRVL